mgnify:CR=1 FL=1
MRFKKALGILRTKIRLLLMIGVLLAAAAGCQFAGEYLHSHYIREEVSETSGNISEKKTVVIDSGHGGKDPGKVGINGAQEKELNLQIAEKLKKYLEEHQITVVMTRTKDERLADSQVEDLKARVELIDKESPALAVCIHQNSYHEENVFGAQVFYYKTSTEGEKAAAVIQEALQEVNPENTKKIKANDTYYLLKKTEVPTVIVECGFLSNYAEAEKLVSEDYQKKLAEAVTKGILQYLKDQ